MKKRRVAIIGGGNGGQSAAFELTQKGFAVHLCEIDEKTVEGIKERGGIEASGKREGFARIPVVTTSIEEAVEGVEAIFPMVPRFAHQDMAKSLAPLLKERQRIMLCPGSTTGEIEFVQIFRRRGRDIPVSTIATLPYAARLKEPGGMHISLVVGSLFFATFPGKKTDQEAAYFQEFFPAITRMTNTLEVGLNNGKPLTHPAPTLLNTPRIERGDAFLFYREGITPSVAAINQRRDEEWLALCHSLGFRTIPLTERLFLTGYANQIYASPLEAYHQSEAFTPILAPKTLQDRYIHEDIPYGLVTFASLGENLGVPTPTINTVITLGSLVAGTDFWKAGMTLSRLGLSRLDSTGLNRFLEEGKSPWVEWAI